jgi:hypothetical protein
MEIQQFAMIKYASLRTEFAGKSRTDIFAYDILRNNHEHL